VQSASYRSVVPEPGAPIMKTGLMTGHREKPSLLLMRIRLRNALLLL
jgi:hypothetical protein